MRELALGNLNRTADSGYDALRDSPKFMLFTRPSADWGKLVVVTYRCWLVMMAATTDAIVGPRNKQTTK